MSTLNEAEIRLVINGEHFIYRHSSAEDPILVSAENAGADVPSSCRAGSCGTCIAKVREGKVEMQGNMFLDDEELEQGLILMCQARPASLSVTLELIG